jgi:hypothetical protein
MHRQVLRLLLPLFTLSAFGCDNGLTAPGDGVDMAQPVMVVDAAGDALDLELPKRDPTDHPPLITMDNYGGPTFSAMEVWTIVWKGDEALGDQINEFVNWDVQSDEYWIEAMGEYGVGKGKAMGKIVLPDAVPKTLDDSAVGPIIKAHIADGLFPQPNSQTVFSFIVPSNTQSTMFGASGCQEYGGYHSETRAATGSKTYVPYAINLQCGGFAGGTDFDSLTEVVSHELAETATDGHPFTKPGYVLNGFPNGGENGDLCNGLSANFTVNIPSSDPDGGVAETKNYFVTRLWSNKAAKAGNMDPCEPMLPNHPYFNVGVNPADIQASVDPSGDTMVIGQFEPYAFGDVGLIKWQLQATIANGITITPEKGTAMAGDTIQFTITIGKNTQSGTYPIDLYTQSAKAGHNQWISTITVQ